MTTIEPMVSDGFDGFRASPPAKRLRWPLPTIAIVLVVVLIAFLLANHALKDTYAIAPGSAQSVQPFISVPPANLHKDSGKILLVTVSLLTVTPFTWLGDKLDHNIQFLKVQQLTGNAPASQLNQQDAVQMQTSTQTAVIVALRRLGYKVNLAGEGAEVVSVVDKSPAAAVLEPGDVIVSFGGTPVMSNDQLVAAIQTHKPGDRVQFQVEESMPSHVATKTVVLGSAPADSVTPRIHAFLGIQTSTKEQPSLPINVTIDPGNIGGPSAGLAFTLGIIDDLTSGNLTGGRTIAVTGTINPDGSVGDVGGVAQKAVAVRNAHAEAFLVPRVELATAQAHAGPKVKVIPVDTLDQALSALGALGGSLTGVPPTPLSTS